MMGRRCLSCVLVVISSCNWLSRDLDGRDGAGILVDQAILQPSSPTNGVLVRVSSRGGVTLHVSIEGGTFVAAAACALEQVALPDGGTAPCDCFLADHQLAVSVRPTTGGEALLTFVLRSAPMCDGDEVASLQVPLQPTAIPSTIDAGVDAAGSGSGSGSGSAGVSDVE